MFETPPRVVPGGARFREVIELGTTSLSSSQVDEVLKRMSRDYLGDRYHLLYRNVRRTAVLAARRGRGWRLLAPGPPSHAGTALLARSPPLTPRSV